MNGLTEFGRLLGLGAVAVLIAFRLAGALGSPRKKTPQRPYNSDFENHGAE